MSGRNILADTKVVIYNFRSNKFVDTDKGFQKIKELDLQPLELK